MQNAEGLPSVSNSKVYNPLKPARSNTIEPHGYKNSLDVRVGVKSCDISNDRCVPSILEDVPEQFGMLFRSSWRDELSLLERNMDILEKPTVVLTVTSRFCH